MLSKNQIKFIRSLQQKKCRDEHGLFVVEGVKLVEELMASQVEVHSVYATEKWQCNEKNQKVSVTLIKLNELERISGLKTPNEVLAIARIPQNPFEASQLQGKLTLALNRINDPGNLGTIIRIADWFGIETVLCSHGTVACYNPKVVQATMGALFRVKVQYVNLEEVLQSIEGVIPVYGAVMEGTSIYDKTLSQEGIIVMGSESHGIDDLLLPFTQPITIPSYGTAESLNVASATAVICAEFKRRANP